MLNRFSTRFFLSAAIIVVLSLSLAAEQKEFQNWPAGASPKEVGKRVAERFLTAPTENMRRAYNPPQIHYAEAIAWYGALDFARLTQDTDLQSRLVSHFDPFFGEDRKLIPVPDHVDNTVFAGLPLEIYIQTKQQKYLDLGLQLVDKQWANPTPDGLTDQSRFWIDDIYMITFPQIQAYRATHDPKYLNHAALEVSVYLDKLQRPDGLFYHAADVPFYWSRGNGWVAAGLTDLLRELPADHPHRARILKGYKKMMSALLKYQGKDGMWHQLLDKPDFWDESSGTAMFTYAMITGVRNGWLPAKPYARAARKGWLGLVSYLDSNGDLKNVCEGTWKKNDIEFYRGRSRNTGDFHGQAPLLWSASALLR